MLGGSREPVHPAAARPRATTTARRLTTCLSQYIGQVTACRLPSGQPATGNHPSASRPAYQPRGGHLKQPLVTAVKDM